MTLFLAETRTLTESQKPGNQISTNSSLALCDPSLFTSLFSQNIEHRFRSLISEDFPELLSIVVDETDPFDHHVIYLPASLLLEQPVVNRNF